MSSANSNDFLSAFYDREAAPSEEPAAKARVEGSPEASREVKEYSRLSRLIQELPRLAAPPEFAGAVMQRAERESLIPLDPVATREAVDPISPLGPRRRWILAVSAAVLVAAALLIAVNVPKKPTARTAYEEIARQEPSSARSALETRRVSTVSPHSLVAKRNEGVVLPDLGVTGAKPMSGTDSAKAGTFSQSGQTAASPPVFVTDLNRGKDATKEAAGESSGKSHELALMLPANLKTAKVGDVVEALQQDGQQVAVVRLTVVNQVEGLDGVQSLLVRNTSRTLQNVDEIKQMRQQFAADKSAEVPKSALPSAPGDLICVYVEGSRDEMLGVLKDLQNESHIQAAELTNTISFTTLEQYASRAVPVEKQSREQSTAKSQIAKGPVVQAGKASGSQLAVSLPAATVDKIFSVRQSTAGGQNSKAAGPAEVVEQSTPALNAPSQKLDVANQKENGPASTDDGQTAKAARRSAAGRAGSRAMVKRVDRSELRDLKEIAAAQKSFQIFFVITDQPRTQTPQPAFGAAKSATRPVTPSAGQMMPAAKGPANSAPPNQAP